MTAFTKSKRTALVSVLVICLDPGLASSQQTCLDWNSPHFFLVATPGDVRDCLTERGTRIDNRSELSLPELLHSDVADVFLDDATDSGESAGEATPLHLAAGFGSSSEVVRVLIENGANLAARDSSGATPLHWAAAINGTPEVIDALLDAGADTSHENLDGERPWDLARSWNTQLQNDRILDRLRPGDADGVPVIGSHEDTVSPPDSVVIESCTNWNTPSFFRRAEPGEVRRCLNGGVDIATRTPGQQTPLHLAAAFSRHPDVIEIMLNAGADKLAATGTGKLPWDYARRNAIVRDSNAGKRLQPVDCASWNSIKFFKSASSREVELCLGEGADVHARSRSGWTPMHVAAAFSATAGVLTTLVESGADVGARSDGGWTPLHRAAEYNSEPSAVETLLSLGAELNARSDDNLTPLHVAASKSRSPDVVQTLLDAEADIRARTATGALAWDLAQDNAALDGTLMRERLRPSRCDDWISVRFFRHVALGEVRRCLAAGRSVDETSNRGWTPLHLAAAFSGTPRIVEFLIDKGADPSARSEGGWTPLHRAAEHANETGILTILLSAGVPPNVVSETGWTPLHSAAKTNRSSEIVSALLNAGADPEAVTADGLTPWDLAQDNAALRDTPAWGRLQAAR